MFESKSRPEIVFTAMRNVLGVIVATMLFLFICFLAASFISPNGAWFGACVVAAVMLLAQTCFKACVNALVKDTKVTRYEDFIKSLKNDVIVSGVDHDKARDFVEMFKPLGGTVRLADETTVTITFKKD